MANPPKIFTEKTRWAGFSVCILLIAVHVQFSKVVGNWDMAELLLIPNAIHINMRKINGIPYREVHTCTCIRGRLQAKQSSYNGKGASNDLRSTLGSIPHWTWSLSLLKSGLRRRHDNVGHPRQSYYFLHHTYILHVVICELKIVLTLSKQHDQSRKIISATQKCKRYEKLSSIWIVLSSRGCDTCKSLLYGSYF